MSITAILFYWRNDTPSFVTWRSRLATTPCTPMCIAIHGGLFTDRVHPPNQIVPEIVNTLPCLPAIVCQTLLIVKFFKEIFSFIGSLDKCHTGIFNALIRYRFYTGKLCSKEGVISHDNRFSTRGIIKEHYGQ